MDACHGLWLAAGIYARTLPIAVSTIVLAEELDIAATGTL